MDKFFVYLLESGVCLTLFYLGYVFLFRKETYFTFNRFYLMLSIILSVGIPLVHPVLTFRAETPLVKQMENIKKFKNYYEKLIYLTDPEFEITGSAGSNMGAAINSEINISNPVSTHSKNKEIWFNVLFWVYIAGLSFFFFRLLYLFTWLHRFSKKNKRTLFQGLNLVQVDDRVPSFSFFNYVFINKDLLTPAELEQVVAHEKIHARQKHSVDLLIAQAMTLFQWFNPLVWRIRKSMKTVHEYLADRKVLEQGYELFDYQSLLLSQLISIRSVELVNNFNLLSIKKRIAMMNKIKSGFLAKLKALFAIPIITVVFILFADLTFDKTNFELTNEKKAAIPETNNFAGTGTVTVKRPKAVSTRDFDMSKVSIKILYDTKDFYINEKKCTEQNIADVLKGEKDKCPDKNNIMATLDIRYDTKMKEVDKILKLLRQNNILKIGYLTEVSTLSAKPGMDYGIARLLPPLDKDIELDMAELKKQGIKCYKIDIGNSIPDIDKTKTGLTNFVKSSGKYIMKLAYSDNTSYDTYILFNDMVNSVFEEIRNAYAQSMYRQNFANLPKEKQNEIKKMYPITLTTGKE